MRQSQVPPCENTARVVYSRGMGMQRAIMCAIMSPDNKLHVYVDQDVLAEFSESVKCFDQHYALELTLLYPAAEDEPPQPEELRCAGGFRALRGGLASDGRLQDQRGVQVVRFTGNTHVAENAFRENESLMELVDVNTIEDIHDNAFFEVTQLRQLGDMPALETIGSNAFGFCDSLTNVGDLPSLTTIGESAFEHTRLTQLGNMPELTDIGRYAFCYTPLTQLGDMPLLKTIGESAFALTSLAQIGDMRSLKTIGNNAFADCRNLSGVRLPKTLTHVGRDAFIPNIDNNTELTGDFAVEPGANFVCKCVHLAQKLRKSRDVSVELEGPGTYRIKALM